LRAIVLEPWQWSIVKQHPAAFVRGCIESAGCRHRRVVAGRNDPAHSFTNHSEDILRLFMRACGMINLHPRRANRVTASNARRADVAKLDRVPGDGRDDAVPSTNYLFANNYSQIPVVSCDACFPSR